MLDCWLIWIGNTYATAFDRICLINSACTRLFTIQEIDKNKKKKGCLGIDNGIIVFGSEVDKVKPSVFCDQTLIRLLSCS
jgi:hypothetical protein